MGEDQEWGCMSLHTPSAVTRTPLDLQLDPTDSRHQGSERES